MRKVALFSALLLLGLIASQWLAPLLGTAYASVRQALVSMTMVALAFIAIHIGYEFELDRRNLGHYGRDYLVAFGAAFLPWLFVTLYFVYAILPPQLWTSLAAWQETMLVARFASPTATGILFSMLAAAGLSATWLYSKARVLVILDDLDTVLMLIPLQALIIGWAWQLGVAAAFMIALLMIAFVWLHRLPLPSTWPWVAVYALAITGMCELIEWASEELDESLPIHVEVLLPAFVLGCLIRRPASHDLHRDRGREGRQAGPQGTGEQRVSTIAAAVFMVLVGLSMPPMFGSPSTDLGDASPLARPTVTISQAALHWPTLAVHVLLVTALANVGKMVPALCYRGQAPWRERLALSIAMWPRGEVGAGILMISASYGIGGAVLSTAMLSLALNLLLTGPFILLIKRLVHTAPVSNVRFFRARMHM